MITLILSLFLVCSIILHIKAEYVGPSYINFIFKPLSTILVILIIFSGNGDVYPHYKYFITLGLIFALAGDIFLMLPSNQFLFGVGSFFITHVCYTLAFFTKNNFQDSIINLTPFLLYGAFLLKILFPYLKKDKFSVIIYMCMLLLMVWQAMERYLYLKNTQALLAFCGATLFVISDSVFALDRFKEPFKSAPAIIAITYYASQFLIAYSVILKIL